MTEHDGVEFGGNCALAMSTGKLDVAGSADHRLVDRGKTYYFKNRVARFVWRVLPDRSVKAEAVWADR